MVVPWCLDHIGSHLLVPPVPGMPRVEFTSRCQWWSTGRGDAHPGLSQTRAEDLVIFWLHKEHTQTHRQKDLELQEFSFHHFLSIALPEILGREGFQTVQAAVSSSETLLWLFWGRKGLQESRFSLHFCSAFLAVKAKLTLRECVLGERRTVQVPLHFYLIAKRSLSSRKWHVLKDLSTYSLK